MFGKLLKNDLKAQWHSMNAIFLITFVVAAVAEALTIFSDNRIIRVMGGFLVFLALGFACLVTIIAVGLLFSKTMFGRAGYLTLTLPVKTDSLIISKTVSGLIWVFTVFSLFIGSFFLWIYQVKDELGEEVMHSVETILQFMGVPSVLTITIAVACFCMSIAVWVLVVVQSVYLGITCSNVAPVSKLGNFGAIIIFFATLCVVNTVSGAISEIIPFGFVVTSEQVVITSQLAEAKAAAGSGALALGLTGTIARLILAVALHFPVSYLVKHRVNVK